MADEIVTRLRNAAGACNHGFPNGAGDSFPDPTYCGGCLRLNDAADEIERLRAAGDHLVRLIFSSTIPSIDSLMDYLRSGIDDWEEARRG